jgi:hypothetical protein
MQLLFFVTAFAFVVVGLRTRQLDSLGRPTCMPYESTLYGSLDMSFHEYCTNEWSLSEKVTVNRGSQSSEHYIARFHCPPLSVPVDVRSGLHLSRRSVADFMKYLQNNTFKVLMVGDSLTTEMHSVLLDSLRAEDAVGSDSGVVFRYNRTASNFMPVPDMMVAAQHTDIYASRMVWADEAVERGVTHLVLNTGAHFRPERLSFASTHPKYRGPDQHPTVDELVAAFAAMFAPGSPLHSKLEELHTEHNIRVIWRDLVAGGLCVGHRNASECVWQDCVTGGSCAETKGSAVQWTSWCDFPNHHLFPVYNAIARKAILGLGGLVIPGVWTSSLGAWLMHPSAGDPLHYCIGGSAALPGMWNSLLFDLIVSHENQSK